MIRAIAVLSTLVAVNAFTLNMGFQFGNFGKKAPAKSAAPAKGKAPAKKSAAQSSGFAGGLVGVATENPFLALPLEFDPFGLSVGKSEETLAWYRAAELKHGRICMLAALGLSTSPIIHLPDPVFESSLGYGALTKLYAERPEAVLQIVVALAAIEVGSLFRNGQGSAGDLGWDPLDLQTKLGLKDDSSKLQEYQLRELKNGRLAMIGASALLLQEFVTGAGPYDQLVKL
jgi:light-harvesting complex I chlorophyll a/b binding protein 1